MSVKLLFCALLNPFRDHVLTNISAPQAKSCRARAKKNLFLGIFWIVLIENCFFFRHGLFHPN